MSSCEADEQVRPDRVGLMKWLRRPVLLLLALLCAVWFGSHVQEKVDRGDRLNVIEQLGKKLTDARQNARAVLRDPSILQNLDSPARKNIPEGNIYLVFEDDIPIDRDFLYGWYNRKDEAFEVRCQNLMTKEVRQSWKLDYKFLNSVYRSWAKREWHKYPMIDSKKANLEKHLPLSPLLLGDNRLIISLPLMCFDLEGEVLWKSSEWSHHSMELDHEQNLWICSVAPAEHPQDRYYHDEIVKIDSQTGKTLYSKHIKEMFLENPQFDLSHLNNEEGNPYHLNDVQPVLADSEHWKQGDVFISLRNISTVLLFRPSTGKILWSNTTSWANQHDVEILNDHTITVFDNNVLRKMSKVIDFKQGQYNRCVVYDFQTHTATIRFADIFEGAGVATPTQGRLKLFEDDQHLYIEAGDLDFFVFADLKQNKWYKSALALYGRPKRMLAFNRWFRLMDKKVIK
jgi:hypothetical protein